MLNHPFPAQALDRGATVVLVVASRDAKAILYRDLFRRLLSEHEATFSLRFFLSRGAADEDVCVPGEAVYGGRVSARALRREVGNWSRDEARFLVIGTGQMEAAAWSWIGILGFDDRRLFDRPLPWRPLRQRVPARATAGAF